MLAALAGRHGVVTRERLLAAGFGRNQIARLVANGTLIPVHRRVYVIVHASSPLASECAAVLACGPRALLSHRTAGCLWKLPIEPSDEIDVTVVGRRPGARHGLRLHYLDAISTQDVRRHDGLPITAPSLTLLDLAGVLESRELAAALNEGRVQRLVMDSELRATPDHHPRRPGARAVRTLLDSERAPLITRSVAERRRLS